MENSERAAIEDNIDFIAEHVTLIEIVPKLLARRLINTDDEDVMKVKKQNLHIVLEKFSSFAPASISSI
jgi:hypothetical protein